jgi:hypothetical protein
MEWVLIVVVMSGGWNGSQVPAVSTAEFRDEASCRVAGDWALAQVRAVRSRYVVRASASCFRAGSGS